MELSISFTDAELVVLADVLGELLPDLGPSTLDRLTAQARAARLAEALDSLRRRGVVITRGGQVEVAVTVARLVEIVCRPAVVVDVYLGAADGGWAAHPHRLSATGSAGVAAGRLPDGLLLTPFSSGSLLSRVAVATGLTDEIGPAERTVTIGGAALVRALAATTVVRARSELEDGLDDGDRDALGSLVAAVTARRGALRVAIRAAGGRGGGLEVAWVAGPDGAWEVPVVATPLAMSVGAERDASDPARPLRLVPIGGAGLLASLASLAEPGGLGEPLHDEMAGR
jgi:hypothetical protein